MVSIAADLRTGSFAVFWVMDGFDVPAAPFRACAHSTGKALPLSLLTDKPVNTRTLPLMELDMLLCRY